MSDKENNSFFSKVINAADATLDNYINKAKAEINAQSNENTNFEAFFPKSVQNDPTHQINSQGFKEKPQRLLDAYLKQMATKDVLVSAIIQTRQNQVAKHSKLVDSDKETGFRIVLKDRRSALDKMRQKIIEEQQSKNNKEEITKSEYSDGAKVDNRPEYSIEEMEEKTGQHIDKINDSDDAVDEYNWEMQRKAEERLEESIKHRRKFLEDFIENSGKLEDRPFSSKCWSFDSVLRAWVRDRLTYDRIATEIIPDETNQPHHYIPVDGSTIKYASPQLKNYKNFSNSQTANEIMYPEKELQYLEEKTDALELDEDLLEADQYKWVQVIRGRVERAYTGDELKVGMFNKTTDIYSNGYSVSELELLVKTITDHLNAEFYNSAYFIQGFSAKGILHIKSPLSRRKMETVRQQWYHMVRGTNKSFQSPIFAGLDEVNWIPLTQNHKDIAFEGWMRYLLRVTCSIYQIDPQEIGFGMKDEGSGGSLSGDNAAQKLKQSKDKGLIPLLRFIEDYINKNIIDNIDSDFCLKFTGFDGESKKEQVERQQLESKFKKTVNEIRAEDNLPPLPGMDSFIAGPEYLQWYMKFSKEAKENQMEQYVLNQPQDPSSENSMDDIDLDKMLQESIQENSQNENVEKALKIEYYNLKK